MEERLEEIRAPYEAHFAKMQVSHPTHTSTLHHCTFIHHGTDALFSDCCPISTSLYRMPCIAIATIGIVENLNYKQLQYEWERLKLSSSAHLCPPHCEQTQCPSHCLWKSAAFSTDGTTAVWTMLPRKACVDVNVYTDRWEFVLLLIPCFPRLEWLPGTSAGGG